MIKSIKNWFNNVRHEFDVTNHSILDEEIDYHLKFTDGNSNILSAIIMCNCEAKFILTLAANDSYSQVSTSFA